MTKKDYILIANSIKNAQDSLLYASTNPGETKRSIEIVSKILSMSLQNDNPLFNTDKFLKACNVK